MKILVIGGGGREHAIIRALKKSPKATELFCAPGNGGIACDATCLELPEIADVVAFAKKEQIDLVFVAPDDPLAAGMVDALEQEKILAFGPRKNAAIIESSKVFSKNLMKKYGIPTAEYEVFTASGKAVAYIEKQNSYPVVIKADGLALGKGVVIAQNFQQAEAAVKSIMEDKVFGASGNQVVIEEFLTGPEVSVLAFTDSHTVVPMVSSKDHKRALDGDMGLNTGGMGTISPNPYYTEALAAECMKRIFLPTINAMNQEGRPFKGCLYFGLILTPKGPKVIEYNARFGDPETQVVLPRLKTDFIDILLAVCNETLDQIQITWSNKAAACVVMASGGYPEKYAKGIEIHGLNAQGQLNGAVIYHAGTKVAEHKFYTNGGRVLGVAALEDTLDGALAKAYEAVGKISFQAAHYRKDIGK